MTSGGSPVIVSSGKLYVVSMRDLASMVKEKNLQNFMHINAFEIICDLAIKVGHGQPTSGIKTFVKFIPCMGIASVFVMWLRPHCHSIWLPLAL